jgi:hypothetical protein
MASSESDEGVVADVADAPNDKNSNWCPTVLDDYTASVYCKKVRKSYNFLQFNN